MARCKIWANTARTTPAPRSAKYRPDRTKSRGFKGSFDKPAFRNALEKALCPANGQRPTRHHNSELAVNIYCKRLAILATAACEQTSSLSPPGAPPTPIAPITSSPDFMTTPPATRNTPESRSAGDSGNNRTRRIFAEVGPKRNCRISLSAAAIDGMGRGQIALRYSFDGAGRVQNRGRGVIACPLTRCHRFGGRLHGDCEGDLSSCRKRLSTGGRYPRRTDDDQRNNQQRARHETDAPKGCALDGPCTFDKADALLRRLRLLCYAPFSEMFLRGAPHQRLGSAITRQASRIQGRIPVAVADRTAVSRNR
jgi:hypothetical protein